MNNPLISVILPIYNAGAYLRPCLDTLVNQSLRDIEIICVLDCPTDGSDQIAEEYAKRDARIRIVKNEKNLNIGQSRNVGLHIARGEYIAFSDHDDTHTLDMYEKLYAATQKGTKKIVCSGVMAKYLSDAKTPFHDYALHEKAFYTLLMRDGLPRFYGHVTPNIYQRAYLQKHTIQFVDTKIVREEDRIFLIEAISHLPQEEDLAVLDKKLYLYRLHETNAHLSQWYNDVPHTLLLVKALYDIAHATEWADLGITGRLLSTHLIQQLYTSGRRNLHEIWNVRNLYVNGIPAKEVINNILHATPVTALKLTLPKTLFGLWLQHSCRL